MAGNAPDTRPDWLLDDSLSEVDQAAIDAIGKDIQENLESSAAGAFLSRGREATGDTGDLGGAPGDASSPPVPAGDGPPPSQASTSPQVDAPAAGGAPPDPDASDPNAPPAPAETFAITVPGSTEPIVINQQTALQLVQQHNWLHGQPEQVQRAWAQIAEGEAQAVTNQEYAAFKAWQASGAPATKPTRNFDMEDLPPEAQRYLTDLESRTNPAAPATTPSVDTVTLTPAQLMQRQQEAVNQQVAIQSAIETQRNRIAAEYGLDAAQITQLEEAIVQSQIIPALNTKYRQVVGNMVISEADPRVVMQEAFDHGMIVDPRFRAIRDEKVTQARIERERLANEKVNGKKAIAGSLSHIPAAAVPSTSGKPLSQMSPQERSQTLNQQMIEELTTLIASGEAAN